jgi:Family of unknown function (DUF6492)
MTDTPRTQVERQMVVVTPTYAPDLELFSELHESVLRWFPTDVRHIAVVPERDLAPFRRFEGPRCLVIGVGDVLPRSVWPLPFANLWVNLRRPVPPLRGWITQQLVKLAVSEQIPERVIVTADSDVVFIRPVTLATFAPSGRVRLYRKDDGVGEGLPRHLRWHAVARDLLGLPSAFTPPLPDYVNSPISWDGDVVRRTLRRVEDVAGRRWLEAIGKELHSSECTLYGVYADEFEQAEHVTLTTESLCHSYWDLVPLTVDRATAFLSSVGQHDVSYMIPSKSNTPLRVRQAAHAQVFGD